MTEQFWWPFHNIIDHNATLILKLPSSGWLLFWMSFKGFEYIFHEKMYVIEVIAENRVEILWKHFSWLTNWIGWKERFLKAQLTRPIAYRASDPKIWITDENLSTTDISVMFHCHALWVRKPDQISWFPNSCTFRLRRRRIFGTKSTPVLSFSF